MSKERYRLITEYPKDEFFDNKQVVKFDSYEVIRTLNQQADKIADLEAKIAESEKKCKETWKDGLEILKDKFRLEQQLAEKEREIISLECVISEIHNDMKEMHEFKVGDDEYDLTDSDARFSLQCDLLNNDQDKISFAVERLEKVKEKALHFYVNDTPKLTGFYIDVNEIDNQIEELKKGIK